MSDLAALRQVIERIRGLGTPPNEEATKFQMVLPILQQLGWDASDPSRVIPEYAVGVRKSGKVDLALLSPREQPVALIEAKAVGVRIEDHVDQVLEYAFKEGVDLCVLTTGIIWWLYLPRERGRPDDRRFAEFDVRTDSIDQLLDDFETYLGYTALVNHEAVKRAQEVLAARLDSERLQAEIPRIWASMLGNPPQELIEIIEARVFSSIRLRPSGEQIGEFLAGLTGSASAAGNVRTARPAPPPPAPGKSPVPMKPDDGKPAGRAKVSRPDGFRLLGQEYPAKRWKDVWVTIAETLYARHPDRFRTAIDSHPNVHLGSQALRSPIQISGSQYWLESHGSADAMRQRSVRLLNLCGYTEADVEFRSA